ncbi:odorant receptor 131-2-like [Chanos chanos]|uniref:Odorant receptor 131-2-like n=1 Tax=Chanos chanos TaxID=29144 RepID=A0A6J2W6Y2_CHACN|nr:odorant receptor 131-2-like [Chanos chanos]
MDTTNDTIEEMSFTHNQIFKVNFDGVTLIKITVVFLMTAFFIYINCIMLFALWSKPIFHEKPRYILFAHMLLNDSILLCVTSVMYALSLALLNIARAICSLLVLISSCTFQNAPLTLAMMSIERFVAICFPLRHSSIITKKSTSIGLAVIWCLSSLDIVIDLIYVLMSDFGSPAKTIFCTREKIIIAEWQVMKAEVFNVLYFVTVTIIIILTYISIMVTARSVSTNKESAKKAQRTVLLHLIQLGLCLASFLYGIIERILALMTVGSTSLFIDLRYLNFLIVLILPRCLSPLIYGLRDDAVRPLFRYYFCYSSKKIKPAVNVH